MTIKRFVIPMAAVAVVGAGVIGAALFTASKALAADSTATGRDSLIQKLADTFHVDKSKVEAVFNEHRATRQAEADTSYQERLSAAVKDGKLTEAQKSAVLTEHAKLKAQAETAAAKTGDERRTAMKSVRDAAEDWAKANSIDVKWLLGGGIGLHMGRGHGEMGHGMMNHGGDANAF